MRKSNSRTKIIATIGPASAPKDVLRQMILEGVDVCRLNFSHGKHEDHLKVIQTVRELNVELNMHVALLADLQGPKLRVGEIEGGKIDLPVGHILKFVTEKCIGNPERVYMSYKEFPMDVKKGEFVLVDDGKLKLEVIDTNRVDTVTTRVVHGGVLLPRKGVNLPNTKVSQPSLTPKDIEDLHFALDHDVDWVALSFVRSATDVVELKEIIKHRKKSAGVISKIEKPEALSEIDNIIDVSDGIMVARGDLGVEVEFEKVPLIQKEIIDKCIIHSRPVIVATQMLESMVSSFRPTRAEATDVANAVIDGADTLMLSGETSTGQYPIETIQAMHKIIQWTEESAYNYNRGLPPQEFNMKFLTDSICFSATRMADYSNAKALVNFSFTGYTAHKLSAYRPKAHLYVFTSNQSIISKMSLVWGVTMLHYDQWDLTTDQVIKASIDILIEKEYIKSDDIVIHVANTPLNEKSRTNMIKISYM